MSDRTMSGETDPWPTEVLNLTPHPITVVLEGQTVLEIAPSGPAARVTLSRGELEPLLINGVSVPFGYSAIEGEIIDLPESAPGRLIIVARLVAESAPARNDLVFPDDLVRDDEGVIVGCSRLSRLSPAPTT